MTSHSRCLATLPDHQPAWLWPARIPAGALTLIVGDPGQGKSLLTLDVAARVTAGREWPDGAPPTEPGDVLLLAAEDSIAATVRSRLLAAGADLQRVHYLKSGEWSRAGERPAPEGILANGPTQQRTAFGYQPTIVADALARDAFQLTEALEALPNCRLVIIDPLPAYLAPVSRNEREQARQSLAPLLILAERSGAAVVAVTHRDPALGAATFDAGNPMTTLAALARTIYLIDRVPNERRRRVLRPIKNNLADSMTALTFDVTDAPGGSAVLAWSKTPVEITDDDSPSLAPVRAPGGPPLRQLDRAIAWLEGALAAGPVLTTELEARAAQARITEITLKRARARVGVKSFRQKAKLGGRWLCALPSYGSPPSDQVDHPSDMIPLSPLTDLVDADEILNGLLTRPHGPTPETRMPSPRKAG